MSKSLDSRQKERRELFNAAMEAVSKGEEGAGDALFNYFEAAQTQTSAEIEQMLSAQDENILLARGSRVQTADERKYFQSVIDALSSSNPQQAISGVGETIPETIMESVFDNIKGNYPILNYVDFIYTPSNVKVIYDASERGTATWGALGTAIATEAQATLGLYEVGKFKLTAYIPLSKDMLTLGASWLDRYVRTILEDYLSCGLEYGFVNGTGLNEPIGMTRDPNSPLDPVAGYEALTPVPLASFSIEDFGAVLTPLKVDGAGKPRKIGVLFFAYNPTDEVTVLAARKSLGPNGYIDIVPYSVDFIESESVTAGTAIVGIKNRYLGSLAGTADLQFSDEFAFLDDNRTYKIKLLGNGRPKDSSSFAVVDISGLASLLPKVETVSTPDSTPEA